MDFKPTAEQFMAEFFRERTAAKRKILESRQDYRLRYFHHECRTDSRDGAVEASEAEKILDVSPSESGFQVVTTGDQPMHRSRYRLKSSGEGWLIEAVDSECSHSRIYGPSYACNKCGGTGWMTWEQLEQSKPSSLGPHRVSLTSRPSPSEEFEKGRLRDPGVEQFMTDYFRDRTLVYKKEVEIYRDSVKRFYSPECDWTRWVVSSQQSEKERIQSIVLVDSGAHVIIGGFTPWRMRYNLRPEGQSWLIWNVDLECFFCFQKGPSADCFWCGGTIWGRKNDDEGPARGDQAGGEPPPETPRWKLE
jgi:hypothetical protein